MYFNKTPMYTCSTRCNRIGFQVVTNVGTISKLMSEIDANLFPISWPATLQSIRLSNMFGICIHAYTIHAIYPVDRQSIVCINYKNLEIHGNPEKSNCAWQETAELVWLWVE